METLTRIVSKVTGWLGSFPAIFFAVGIIIAWLIGLLFVPNGVQNNSYQLIINTATTCITFVMVFVVQHTQNREERAVQVKLDAILTNQREILQQLNDTHALADELMELEDKPEKEIKRVQERVRES